MRQLAPILFLGSSLLAACAANSGGDTDTDTAASIVDSSDSLDTESNVMMASVDGADTSSVTGPDAGQIAARIAANIEARWSPAGCAVATVSAGNISVAFDGCSGPRGMVDVSGTHELSITSASGAITLTATGDLTINGGMLSFNSTASLATTGTGQTLSVQTTGSGTGSRGNEVTHDGTYTLAWDSGSQCRDLTAQYDTDLSSGTKSATRSTDLSLSRCATACPTGTIAKQGLLGETLTVTFDGSAVATWSSSRGPSGTINLMCQ